MAYHNVRDVNVRFIEQRVRGEDSVECVIEVVEELQTAHDTTVIYPMGKTWDDALETYPTLGDILDDVARLDEFNDGEPATFNVISMEGAAGLYDKS